ncbi:D-2-hydroxyacid dehydrogenase family protein [Pseudarthrobacter sp. PS3-L1]|uniref:D-2-hydroxyacid dehydrogenase family protein n=1 Tax=Pseudarthrobacter sp. PS3-L1 TaxID=3046207 RepID=UPI0024BA831E|nr:D-2-hydroxyacid dehydrogenase family protein [Pseudarthrobacter sp. PS3-L1]MDJ0320542.1 D-2-hydroxyacid dehydrogenase family protein [Pseudarthrobacter sp. PS3-L1]
MAEHYRLAILDDYQRVAMDHADWGSLADHGVTVTVFTKHFGSEQEAVATLADFHIIIAMRERTPFPRSVLEQLPNLDLLVTTGPANASIDVTAAADLGITVCGTEGSPTAAPELTWALILAFARNLPMEHAALREGRWQSTVGFELAGRTLGILGLGKIGRRIAAYGAAFGMTVVAWSENLTAEAATAAGATLVDRDELFRRSDVVSLHVRLSPRTESIVGAAELQLLGPDGLLVNTSRGALVDEDALLTALEEGWIRGAALDVYNHEPLPAGHPLLSAPNTVLAPHLGFVTAESYDAFYGGALEDVRAWLSGSPIRRLRP